MDIPAKTILIETEKAYFVKATDDLGFWIPKRFYSFGKKLVSVPDDFEIKLRAFEIDSAKTRYYGDLRVKIVDENEFKPLRLTKERLDTIKKINSLDKEEVELREKAKKGVFKSKNEADETYKNIAKNEAKIKELEASIKTTDKTTETKKANKKTKQEKKPNTMREIKSPIAIEKQLEKDLVNFSAKINKSVKFWGLANFNKNFDKNTAKQLSFEFNKLTEYWEKEAKEVGKNLSRKFANFVKKYVNSKFLSENASFNKKGLSKLEKNQLSAIYEQNLGLIKTIPRDIIERYKETLLNKIGTFDREALEKQAKTISGISKRRAKLIARDQTQKAVSNYQSARAEALGFEYYMWQTAQDERVSKGKGGHRQLNGRIYKYSEPTAIIDTYGNKGKPSERVNCRCVALSLYLEQDETLKLVKDSEAGDYYKIVKKSV